MNEAPKGKIGRLSTALQALKKAPVASRM